MSKTKGGGDKEPINLHGGWRPGAGRKPALLPLRLKKFRASDEDWAEFMSYLTGDAKNDFILVLYAFRSWDKRMVEGNNGIYILDALKGDNR